VGVREPERSELHNTIWRGAKDLRGAVGGRDFTTYVPWIFSYRFISENLTAYLMGNYAGVKGTLGVVVVAVDARGQAACGWGWRITLWPRDPRRATRRLVRRSGLRRW